MLIDLVLIFIGFVALILMMAFVLNPPEAWVKRMFLSGRQRKNQSGSTRVPPPGTE